MALRSIKRLARRHRCRHRGGGWIGRIGLPLECFGTNVSVLGDIFKLTDTRFEMPDSCMVTP